MGTEDLENVYDQVYLGADIAGDGDQRVAMNHRCNIAWGRFNEHRKVLTTTKLPLELRLRLYALLIISTMIYGCCAWLLTDDIKRSLNGVNSKMLSAITRRTIHEEARAPSLDTICSVLRIRRSYLGHILRMDENRAVRRFLLELSPKEAPFIPGSLLDDTEFTDVEEIIRAAEAREL